MTAENDKASKETKKLDWALLLFACIFWWLTRGSHPSSLIFILLVSICYLALRIKNGPILKLIKYVSWEAIAWVIIPLQILICEMFSHKTLIWQHEPVGEFERWEMAALTWNIVFFILSYFITLVSGGIRGGAVFSGLLLIAYTGAIAIGFHAPIAAISALEESRFTDHLRWVFLIAACELFVTCCIIANDLVRTGKLEDVGRSRFKVLLYVNIPTLFAIGGLWIFNHYNSVLDEMPVFLSGAIAFQFIISSFLFAMIEGGVVEAFETNKVLEHLGHWIARRFKANKESLGSTPPPPAPVPPTQGSAAGAD